MFSVSHSKIAKTHVKYRCEMFETPITSCQIIYANNMLRAQCGIFRYLFLYFLLLSECDVALLFICCVFFFSFRLLCGCRSEMSGVSSLHEY